MALCNCIKLYSIFVQASVFLCQNVYICVCMDAYFQTDILQTDGSGALHTHVEAVLMPAYCFARCMCVLLWVCYSLRQPGLVLRPLMASERGAPADRVPGTPQTTHYRGEGTVCFMAFFYARLLLS